MVGNTISHYSIMEKIGQGGMGEVYLADDTRLGRKVAIKVLPSEFASHPESMARLEREARSAAALNNPYVCTIHEVGEEDDQTYIVMEYVEGTSLAEHVPAKGLSSDQVVRYGSQIAQAVAHAHERGIIHRDLKTSNVMIASSGIAKVLDFGLAKPVESSTLTEFTQSMVTLTEAGSAVGTLPYMAPEVLKGEPADEQSDIWSLGVLLFTIATGAEPFQGNTGFELSSEILTTDPPLMPTQVSLELQEVIRKCLAKDPSDRFQQAGEVARVLNEIEAGAKLPIAKLISHQLSRNVLWIGSALAALVITVLLFGSIRSSTPFLVVMPPTDTTSNIEMASQFQGFAIELDEKLKNCAAFRRIGSLDIVRLMEAGQTRSAIATDQDIDYFVDPIIREDGDRISISVQILSGRRQEKIWTSESFHWVSGSVDRLARLIAIELAGYFGTQLTDDDESFLATAGVVDSLAEKYYLDGLVAIQTVDPDSYRAALNLFRRATQIEPDYAKAHAGLAVSILRLRGYGESIDIRLQNEARAAADRAESLDPTLPAVFDIQGDIARWFDRHWTEAENQYRAGIELYPNDINLLIRYGGYLVHLGKADEGLSYIRRAAVELEPQSSNANLFYGYYLWFAGRFDEAINRFMYLLDILADRQNPAMESGARRWLSMAYGGKGRYEDALHEINVAEEIRRTNGLSEDHELIVGRATIYANIGRNAEAIELMEALEADDKIR
ncbi:protein kinase, partial [Gemmatimonadota bacterium]